MQICRSAPGEGEPSEQPNRRAPLRYSRCMEDNFPYNVAARAVPVTHHEACNAVDAATGEPMVMLHLVDANDDVRYYRMTRSQAYAFSVGVFNAAGGNEGLPDFGIPPTT
jgi:hypothetical protein